MKIRHEYLTQSQLGDLFGVSSHNIGHWLADLGLRDDRKKPTKAALDGGFVKTGPSRGYGTYHWIWHAEKTVAALRRAGHQTVPTPPLALVEPPKLVAPFSVRPCDKGFGVMNGEGDVCLMALTEEIADLTVRLLSVANKCGVMDRLAAMDGPLPHNRPDLALSE